MSLELRGLSVRRGARLVLADIALSAARGQVTAIIGPNGAGKSSLLKAVLGLLPSESGGIAWEGRALPRDPQQRARLLAYVPQRSQLSAALPVRAVVAAARYAHHGWWGGQGAGDAALIAEALAAVDASELAARPFTALSAGEQQRVLIARALASEAPCILMDEPSASLDVSHALALFALIRRLAAAGRAIVIVLHHLDDARRIADRVVVLERGALALAGTPAEVFASPRFAEVFGVEPLPGGAWGFALRGSERCTR
ncbi:MAG: ABC transporter ATP-binding protein [Planctomycetota bacterium]|nr:ABC transporter ATP-binding protein [Planctomycetota bacterium]MCX8039892.1 ABC transporter ATP-binding protein [Planctomycetota bacterium]MDW8373474.1 ABC transporter ATP-binding protein [Planctomycetota bacterium]